MFLGILLILSNNNYFSNCLTHYTWFFVVNNKLIVNAVFVADFKHVQCMFPAILSLTSRMFPCAHQQKYCLEFNNIIRIITVLG